MNYERRRMKEVKVEIEAKAEEWENPSDRPPARPTGVIRAGMKEFILSGRLESVRRM